MRAARKCSPTRGMRSTAFSTRRLRRPLRNLPQNRPELLIPQVSPVVAEGVFVKVGLQVLRAHAVVHAADPALHKTPEPLNRLGVNVARDVDSRAVIDSPVNVSRRFQPVVRNVLIGVNGARGKDIFFGQTVKSRFLRVRRYTRHYAPLRGPRARSRSVPPFRQPQPCANHRKAVRAVPVAVFFRRGTSRPFPPSNPPVADHPRTRDSESGGTCATLFCR